MRRSWLAKVLAMLGFMTRNHLHRYSLGREQAMEWPPGLWERWARVVITRLPGTWWVGPVAPGPRSLET